MKTFKRFLTTSLLAAVLLVPSSKAAPGDGGLFDGQWWRMTSQINDHGLAHLAYVHGALDTGLVSARWPKLVAALTKHTTFGDISDALDEFYSHPENRSIPIVWALTITEQKFAGASQQEIEEMTENWRRAAAALPTQQQ